ncbi:MAG: hypothetical protein AAF922_07235 [Pseudomonadota bacterium]
MKREEICRRLLGTATQLFLDSKDPVSVHALASNAIEHADFLAQQHKGSGLKDHVLAMFPDMELRDLKRMRNKHYRVIKHSHNFKNEPFDISKEMADFGDTSNDYILFNCWFDFMGCGFPIPLAAQVFQTWFFRMYPKTLNPEHDFDFPLFDILMDLPRFVQKQKLCEAVIEVGKWKEVMEHENTDRRPLCLG